MRTLKKLEARIKMLECGVNRGHSYWNGSVESHKSPGRTTITVTLKCLFCNYELTKRVCELSEKEKEAAVKLGLIPKKDAK